jgi:hypothetical protein
VFGARATHPLVNATIVNGCGLLATLFVPLLASLGTLLGTLDGDAEQHIPTADRGWLKSCCLGTTGMMGGDATLSFCGALGASVNTWRHHESAPPCAPFLVILASVPPGVMARPPLSTGLIVAWVPHVSFRSLAYLTVLLTCQGLTMWAWLS